jgi:hypothetical protein
MARSMRAVTCQVFKVAASGVEDLPIHFDSLCLSCDGLGSSTEIGSYILPITPIIKLQEVPIHTSKLTRKGSAVGLRLHKPSSRKLGEDSRGSPRLSCSVRLDQQILSEFRYQGNPLSSSFSSAANTFRFFPQPTDTQPLHLSALASIPTLLVCSHA